MTSKHALQLAGLVAAAFGVYLFVQTGAVALALGAVIASVGAEPAQAPAHSFWFQLSFIRLFAASLLAFAMVLVWSAAQLTPVQQRSFARVLAGTFALLAFVALMQQVAIWTVPLGWGVVAVLGAVATLCGIGSTRRATAIA